MTPEPRSVAALFLSRVKESPADEAYLFPAHGGWSSVTWAEARLDVRAVALGLGALGLGLGSQERCAILCSTRLEWVIADLAVLCAGGATTTIYPSSTAEECAHVLADSGARICVAEDDVQVAKLAAHRAALPALAHVVVLEGRRSADGWVVTWADLVARGRAVQATRPGLFEERVDAIAPTDLATLIYTSGTTGRSKGVELTHGCWLAQSAALAETGIMDHPDPLHLFWLPFAHSFGKMMITLQLRAGFPTAIDGRLDRLPENLLALRPTMVCGVPRAFEKIRAAVLQTVSESGAPGRALARWAFRVATAALRAERAGRSPGLPLSLARAFADRLVLGKVRAAFGGRLRFFVCGSAPLSPLVEEYFAALGIPILEGYGLTETSAATHVNLPSQVRPGTVGPALRGVEARIAPDGEVLLRGPWVTRGYHGLPEATREAIDEDGWLRTGDVGRIDEHGHLVITDRKKDLIKTAGGKYVAPQEIEGLVKALCPQVAHVVVHGDRRPYVTALVALDPALLRAWAARWGLAAVAPEDLPRHPEVERLVAAAVERANAKLPRFAKVRRFAILAEELTEAAGELTPSQKVRRTAVEARHRGLLDALYADA